MMSSITEPENNVAPLSPETCITEGLVNKKKNKKTGAEQILKGIRKRQSPGMMVEKELELCKKLAMFEAVREEMNVETEEAAASHLGTIPQLDWIKTPRHPCSSEGSRMSSHAVSLAREFYDKFANNDQLTKTFKKDACMKYMNIEGHPCMWKEWYMERLPGQAAALGVSVVETFSLCFRSIGISRTLPPKLVADSEQVVHLSEKRKSSMRFLYVLLACDVAAQLKSRELTSHMAARKRMLRGQITLVILDTAKYFKKGTAHDNLSIAITDMLVTLEIDTCVVNSPEELSTLILQYTKAVAEEPAKLLKRAVDDQAQFYMRGDNKNCVTVDRAGNGIDRLWQQMLSVLPQSSLEVSRAISAEFPSPAQLAKCVSTKGGVARLADTGVARSGAPGARARRLGPEMANKINMIFTVKDGHVKVE